MKRELPELGKMIDPEIDVVARLEQMVENGRASVGMIEEKMGIRITSIACLLYNPLRVVVVDM